MSALRGYSTPRAAGSNTGGTATHCDVQQTPSPLASHVQSAIGNKQPPAEPQKPAESVTCPKGID